MKQHICFLATSMRDALFYNSVMLILEQKYQFNSYVISCTREVDLYFEANSDNYFSLHKYFISIGGQFQGTRQEIIELEQTFNIESFWGFCNHEGTVNKISNKFELYKKAFVCLNGIQDILQKNPVDLIIQEIGGWVAVQSLWKVANILKIDHLFIEPSMFIRRAMFWHNHWGPMITGNPQKYILNKAQDTRWEAFIEKQKTSKERIIPTKDKKMITDIGLWFILNPILVKKAVNAIDRKFFVNKGFDVVAPLSKIVQYNLFRYYHRKRNQALYSPLVKKGKAIFFPFHHPVDFQLVVRAPQFFDQELLVRNISNQLPAEYTLFIKEHPVCIGAYPHDMLKRLSRLPNIKILHPMMTTQEVLPEMDFVITVNSKVGYEALLQNKRVITLAQSFYSGLGLTIDLKEISQLSRNIREFEKFEPSPAILKSFIQILEENSQPFDLFNQEQGMLVQSAETINKQYHKICCSHVNNGQ
jgi:hypothetical protein